MTDVPEVRYAMSGDVHIAYQSFGDGPHALVLNPGAWTHLELDWTSPVRAKLLNGLGAFARVVMYDKRGTGLSDRGVGIASLEVRIDDVRAVMDAEGIEGASLLGYSEGGAMAALFAATHPDRVLSLVLHGITVTGRVHSDVPGSAKNRERMERELDEAQHHWGSGATAGLYFGEDNVTPDLTALLGKYQRSAASPADAATLAKNNLATDIRAILPTIVTPTLVIARTDDAIPVEMMSYVAEQIPGAEFLEQDGPHAPWAGPSAEAWVEKVRGFVEEKSQTMSTSRVLSTVLFTDIVSSTDRAVAMGDSRWSSLLDRHDQLADAQVRRFRGNMIKSTGDGILATFDAPGRAVSCAQALLKSAHEIDLDLRMGLHTGEIELRGSDIGGIGVNIAARVEAAAADGEIFVTRTVTDLVAGSGLSFEERGEHTLKGVPGQWQLFAVAD